MPKPLPDNPFVRPHPYPTVTRDHVRSLWKGLDKYNMPNEIKRLIVQKYMQGKSWGWSPHGKMYGPHRNYRN